MILTGEFGEDEYKREGLLEISQGMEYYQNNAWNVTFGFGTDGVNTITSNKAEEYGYTGLAPTFYSENSSTWQEFEPEQDIVLAAFNLDAGNGVAAYSCELFQNKDTKYVFLPDNAGVLLFHIVFSEKDVTELKREYEIPTNVKELFEAKNPYIGNHVADGKIMRILSISAQGVYTMELQTTEQPYGITMHFEKFPEN